MKKIISFCLITLVILSACSKQKQTDSIDFEKVNEVMNLKGSNSERVLSIGTLNSGEKAFAWKKHIQEYSSKLELTSEQKSLINKAIAFIVPELYINEKKDSYAGQLSLLDYKLSKGFPAKEYTQLFHSLQIVSKQANTPAPLSADCVCRVTMWCSLGDDLSVCDWNIGCTQVKNCGIFGTSACRGQCTRYPLPTG